MDSERKIYVAGYPSFHGGADTELYHQIVMLRAKGVGVTLVPMYGADPAMKSVMTSLGCFTRDYHPAIFKDRIVVSFCNGGFLEALPAIHAQGKPRAVVWANCMTWTFPHELTAHANGWITHHVFQTDYQREWLMPALRARRAEVHTMPYLPYYDLNESGIGLNDMKITDDYYGVGRISRDDAAKYSADMWPIFDRVLSPIPKKVFVLGFGPNARIRCGLPPATIDYMYWGPGGCPASKFYPRVHTLIHKTGGSRENLPRIMMEAWRTGTALICEDDYGFREHVMNGVNGYRCSSSDEMAYRASELAFSPDLRMKLVRAGRKYLEDNFGDADLCWKGWEKMFSEV